mmetsp:Transcript_13472/g.44397  ORF Transcript_13472/g.44397 Transcript_13472/m.44397 type:complete len:233 (-) Transcript_13472:633-1331(-)
MATATAVDSGRSARFLAEDKFGGGAVGGGTAVGRGHRRRRELRRLLCVSIQHVPKLTEALNHGRKRSQSLELVDDEGDISKDVVEGGVGLRYDSKLDVAGKIQRGDDSGGEELNEEPVRRGESLEVPLRDDDAREVIKSALEAVHQQPSLVRLAAVKRNALRVLSHSDEGVSEVRLECLLAKVERHERASDDVRERRAPDCVSHKHPAQRWRDAQKDTTEGDEVDGGVEEDE